jgi:hypothetical protein
MGSGIHPRPNEEMGLSELDSVAFMDGWRNMFDGLSLSKFFILFKKLLRVSQLAWAL